MNEKTSEVWVLDLDSAPVVVNEDGTTEPLEDPVTEEPAAEEPAVEPVEDPVANTEFEPVETPAETLPEETTTEETPVEDVPAEETPAETTTENEVLEDEIPEEPVVEILSTGEEDLTGYRTISLTSIDVLETEQSGDVSNVMVEVIESVLGEYQRRTYTVEEYDTEGNLLGTSTEYVPGLAGLDYAWITGAILFGMFIGGIFKLLGGLMRS